MANCAKLLLSCLLLLAAVSCAQCFRVRRYRRWFGRSRKCVAKPCEWGVWAAWGACTHPCGSAGLQRRKRLVDSVPSCGGASCHGSASQSRACNRFCHNGGTAQPGRCLCKANNWGTCCEHREYRRPIGPYAASKAAKLPGSTRAGLVDDGIFPSRPLAFASSCHANNRSARSTYRCNIVAYDFTDYYSAIITYVPIYS